MADLEATLRPFVDSGHIPGLVALVARGDELEVVTLGARDSTGAPRVTTSTSSPRATRATRPGT